jgi:TorA maturation chaperone TorD
MEDFASMDQELSDWVSVMKGRAAFYEFFSMIYRKPIEESFLPQLKNFAPHFLNHAKEVDTPLLIDGAEQFLKFTEELDGINDLLNTLNRSYTSLFLLGGNSIPTSESVYLSPEKLVKQDQWEQVRKIYYEQKVPLPASFKEPEDHISMELHFMDYMANITAEALSKGDEELAMTHLEVQLNFLNNHLMKWAPIFCDFVINKSSGHVIMFKSVTMLLKGFLAYDVELLTSMLADE